MSPARLLLIGYGNPARGDDGLGPAFVDRISQEALRDLTCLMDYQLTVDHALAVGQAGRVVFADASLVTPPPFSFERTAASDPQSLMSHSLTPSGLLSLARSLYGREPEAHVMAIAGHDFDEVREGLGRLARENLECAVQHFLAWYRETVSGN